MRFYGNFAHVGCGHGCHSKLQKILFDENGEPLDIDWEGLQQIYNDHNSTCSTLHPYTDDANAFYGNPDDCTGFVVEGEPSSGYRYCEY